MFVNNMNFPNQILDSIKQHSLVVFAGAGASAGVPTSLPDFEKLAEQLAEGSAFVKGKEESCEVFLGTLKANHIDVNSQAASLLSEACLKHNKLHEAIVDLFLSSNEVRIVTTNYDQMFEQVLDEKEAHYSVFDAPALPLGNDVSGIVHIHGNVNNPKYMVVTDDDFGKAYLTDGYASKFLTKLFDSYTVLFVGYSYNDTILRYLTRAMSRDQLQKRYILTDNRKVNWENLGITPIYYPKRSYGVMREGLEKIGIRAKRSLSEWRDCLALIAEAPPKDLTSDSEIDFCLENKERIQVLANIVSGEEWLKVLEKKGQFANLFIPGKTLTSEDQIWKEWICKKIIGKEDEAFKNLIFKHDNSVNRELAHSILLRIEGKDIPNNLYQEYSTILEGYADENHLIWRLINVAKERGLITICESLYKKFWDIRIITDKGYWPPVSIIYKHVFLGDEYTISNTWETCQFQSCLPTAKEFLVFYKSKLIELHKKYLAIGLATKENEPWEIARIEIEDKTNYHSENVLYCMVEHMAALSEQVENGDPAFLKEYLRDGIQIDSVLGKRVFLRLIRQTNVFSSDECFDILRNENLLGNTHCKEQVFLLVKKIFDHLSFEYQNTLIDYIESVDTSNSEYEKYNWCVWIQRECAANDRINSIIQDILSRNNFEPREHPEKDIYFSSATWVDEKSPINYDQMQQMSLNDAAIFLRDYKEDSFNGPTRWGALKTFSKVICDNVDWAKGMPSVLEAEHVSDEDVWEHYFQGLYSTAFPIEVCINILEILVALNLASRFAKQSSEFIWKLVQRDELKENCASFEERIWKIIEVVWANQENDIYKTEKLIDLTLNTTEGLLLHSMIYLISYNPELRIDDKYKSFFEKAMTLKGQKRDIAVCILAGHFNFFYFRDKGWCEKQFVNILKGINKATFVAAWEGMVYFSGRLNSDLADVMSPIYLSAISHINWLSGESRKGIIELYLTLIIYVVKNPITKYIPTFFKFTEQDDRIAFLSSIARRLRSMDDIAQINWWNTWLRKFVTNLTINKPIMLSENELKELFECIPESKSIYGELVKTLCKGRIPQNSDDMLFYELYENKCHIDFPNETALLITSLLNANTGMVHGSSSISKIVEDLTGLSNEERKELDEALLKRNIQTTRS